MKRKNKKSFNWYGLKQRFSIRKYHFGAASVLIGTTLFLMGGPTAQASEQNGAQIVHSVDSNSTDKTKEVATENASKMQAETPAEKNSNKQEENSTENVTNKQDEPQKNSSFSNNSTIKVTSEEKTDEVVPQLKEGKQGIAKEQHVSKDELRTYLEELKNLLKEVCMEVREIKILKNLLS